MSRHRANPRSVQSAIADESALARLAAIEDSAEEAIIGKTLDGIITHWNAGAVRLYGYTPEEAIGKHISMLAPPSRVHEIADILKRIAAQESVPQFETVRQTKDGRLIDVALHVSPIRWNNRVIGATAGAYDITSRKRMEEALRRSEERFRFVARATKDVIWDLDIRSNTLWRSDSFWSRFGHKAINKDSELTPQEWEKLVHPEDLERVWRVFKTAIARQSDSFECEYRFLRADGTYATVLDRAHIAYDEAGEATRAVGAVTDLSDYRKLEDQFRQAQKMEALGKLAGGVAHDFNNLLMIIATYAQIGQEQCEPDSKLHQHLQQVLNASDRASSLTRQLLAFSRKNLLCLRVLNLNLVIADTLKMVKRIIGEDIELTTSMAQNLWPVKGDADQLIQVLMNLCVNARDAMPEKGTLQITTQNSTVGVDEAKKLPAFVPGDYVLFTVADTGIGMSSDVKAQIFEPFFTTKEAGKGTGLGLSTVYGIVKQSGGYIQVESAPGQGSTFRIYLPATHDPLTAAVTREFGKTEGHGETILIVEDEETLRESIATYLGLHGYQVMKAESGSQALDLSAGREESIAIVLLDMVMPKMSGMELANELLKRYRRASIIYMSGYPDRMGVPFDTEDPGTMFLQKPFALQTLLTKIREVLKNRTPSDN